MTERSDRPLVGRRAERDHLLAAWERSAQGPVEVIVGGGVGSGRTVLVQQAIDAVAERDTACVLRLHSTAIEDGVQGLLRGYGSLVTALARNKGFDSDPADALDRAGEAATDTRVKAWLVGLAKNVRELRATGAGAGFQIRLPADNPWLAVLYGLDVLGPRGRFFVDVTGLSSNVSPAFWTFFSALLGRARSRGWKMCFVLTPGEAPYGEKPGEDQPGPASFLAALSSGAESITPGPLSVDEVGEFLDGTYRPHRFPAGLAERLHKLSAGHPETLHELLDTLEEDETVTWDETGYRLADLDDVDLDVLVPLPAEPEDDADEADGDDEPAPDDALMERVLHVAAIAGRSFPGSLIRTALGAGEDEVDDALDAMEHIVTEVEHQQTIGSWIYRFRKEYWRSYYRALQPDGWKEKAEATARKLAVLLLQSYAPASFEFIPMTARLFVESGDPRSARNLAAMAMGSERPELVAFAIEVAERHPDAPYPPGLVRFLFASQAERAVNGAAVDAADAAVARAEAWAREQRDGRLLAYCGLLRCRIAVRRGDWPSARAAGEGALPGLQAAGDTTRLGETLNQLAMVALNMGDDRAAEEFVRRAEKASTIPPVKGHSLYIHGLLQKKHQQVAAAAKSFERAAELATEAGNLPLVLESMLQAGESGLMSGRGKEIAPLLERALEMSRALRSPPRERVAARLLCQAEAARGRGPEALAMAKHALELTRELGRADEEHIDLYHCGLFAVMAGKADDGADFLLAARGGAERANDDGLVSEILFNVAQVRLSRSDFDGARALMEESLSIARRRNDRGRELRIVEHLAIARSAAGDHEGAAVLFKEAMDKSLGPQAKPRRKALRQRWQKELRLARGEDAGADAAGDGDDDEEQPGA